LVRKHKQEVREKWKARRERRLFKPLTIFGASDVRLSNSLPDNQTDATLKDGQETLPRALQESKRTFVQTPSNSGGRVTIKEDRRGSAPQLTSLELLESKLDEVTATKEYTSAPASPTLRSLPQTLPLSPRSSQSKPYPPSPKTIPRSDSLTIHFNL